MKFHDFHYSSNRTIKYLYLSEYFIVKKGLQKAKQLQTNKIFIKPDILDNLIVYLKGGIKMNKKGLSDVVTTVLIILLALAAIVIVWQAVKGTVQGGANQLTDQTKCMGVDLSVGIITANSVVVTRNAGGSTDPLTPKILLKGAVVGATCAPKLTLLQLESTTCTLTVTTPPTAIANGDEVTVGGTVTATDGTQVACPTTAKKTATLPV